MTEQDRVRNGDPFRRNTLRSENVLILRDENTPLSVRKKCRSRRGATAASSLASGCPESSVFCFASAAGAASKAKSDRKPRREAAVGCAHALPCRRIAELPVSWTAFADAANLQLNVVERRDLFGWSTWHFRAATHTVGSVRSLFEIDDQFDSYTDAVTLEGRQYEVYLNELGRKQEQVVHMLPRGEVSKAPAPIVAVVPGTRDPLGALYVLRGVDWKATPEVTAPVYDGHDVYEIRAKLEVSRPK